MIEAKVKLLLQMSLVLIWGMSDPPQKAKKKKRRATNPPIGANKPVIRIARIAGQFAK